MPRRDGISQLVGGLAVLAWGVLAALLVSVIAYGGLWETALPERLLWFSPAIVAFVVGVAMVSAGALKLARDQRA